MSDQVNERCRCPRCTIRSLMGPAVLVTLGILFLLGEMRGGPFSFTLTYPIVLVVIGVILLGSALAPTTGHIEPVPPIPPPPGPPYIPPPTAPGGAPPYSGPYQGQGR